MSVREHRARLKIAVQAKMQRHPELQDSPTCNLTYGEVMQALRGLPKQGNLDAPLVAYKAGNLPFEEMEKVFDEFFGGPIVRSFSTPKEKTFYVTFNVPFLNKTTEHIAM